MHAPVGAVRGNGSIPRAVTPVLRSPPAAPCVALFRATRRPRALSSRTAPCVACASRLFPLGMGVRADCDLAHLGPAAYHGGASGEARGRGCHVLSLRELRKVRLVPAAGHGALPALQDGAHPRAPALCRLRLDASPAARSVPSGSSSQAELRAGLLQRIWRKMAICFEIPRQSAPLARQCADPHRRDLGKRALRRWQGGLGESGSSEFRRKWPKNASRRARPRASRSHAPARPTRPRAPHARVPRPGATAPRRCRSGSGPWRSAPRCRLPLSPRSRGTGRWPASRSRCGTAGTT